MRMRPAPARRRAWAERLPSVSRVMRRRATNSCWPFMAKAVRMRRRPALAMMESKDMQRLSGRGPQSLELAATAKDGQPKQHEAERRWLGDGQQRVSDDELAKRGSAGVAEVGIELPVDAEVNAG